MENRIFFGRYRLSLGGNGLPVELHRAPSARTYRAQEIETGREVALTLSPAPRDRAVLERLQAEAVKAQTINQINIPRLYDFGLENNELIYVSEYCDGHSAAAWVAARGPLSITAVLRVALQVADAMNATAFQRLHHPALNPDNILFVAGQTVEGDWPPIKVMHWYGPSPAFSDAGDPRVEVAARFAAPEQLPEGEVDVRSEIYSLGATIYFLLTGAVPAIASAGVAKSELARLRGVPKIVRHLLERMLRPNPLERPQDPVALGNYLHTCLARIERRANIGRRMGIPITSQPRMVAPKSGKPLPLKPLALAAALLVPVALVLLLFHWPSARRKSTAIAEQPKRPPASLPNESPFVSNDTREPIDESEESSASIAAASGISRSEAAPATPPASAASETPRHELAITTTESSPSTSAPPPPEEGPSALTAVHAEVIPVAPPLPNDQATETPVAMEDGAEPRTAAAMPSPRPELSPDEEKPETEIAGQALVENDPEVTPIATPLPNDQTTGKPAAMADTAEPHAATAMPSPHPELSSDEEKPMREIAQADAPTSSPPNASPTKPASTRRKSQSVAERSGTHSATRKSHLARVARRARAVPKLRVGSARAELVGTTRDGRWILSVADTGEEIIVPPPPGYGP